MAPRAGFEPAVRSNVVFECRTGDSRAYSRPAPASRGPGYTTSTRPTVGPGASPEFVLGNHASEMLALLNLPENWAGRTFTIDRQQWFRQGLNLVRSLSDPRNPR